MNLYEFEGKELFKKFGIKVPNSQLLNSPNEKLTLSGEVIGKAQVLFGGRGKKGLVKKDYLSIFSKEVDKVLVEEFIEATKLHYLSITYDTEIRGPVLLYSAEGGVEIEQIKTITKEPIEIISENLPEISIEIDKVTEKLWNLFKSVDARLVEINPLAETSKGLIALDAKIILDDDALFRHQDFNFELPQHETFQTEFWKNP